LAEQVRQETARLEQKYGLSQAQTPPLAELLPPSEEPKTPEQNAPMGDR